VHPQGRGNRVAGHFVDALGDERDEGGRSADRLRIGAMAGAVALVVAVTAGVAAWPALRSALRPAPTARVVAPATPPPAATVPAPASGPAAGGPAAGGGRAQGPVFPGSVAAAPAAGSGVAPQPQLAAVAAPAGQPAATPAPAPTAAPQAAAAAAPAGVRFSFEDGGTDGWGGHGHVTSVGSGTVAHDGGRSLQAVMHSTSASDLPYVSVSVSGASAPAAGQTLTAFVFVSGSANVQGKLFVQDTRFAWHLSPLVGLGHGGWVRLSLTVPSGIQVNQVGVQFLCSPVNQNATVFVDSVGWS
jgi:hypothetical protein